MERRVRVEVNFGDSHVDLNGARYTYLVPKSQAQVGSVISVPVNRGKGVYHTTATVTSIGSKSTIKRPRKSI